MLGTALRDLQGVADVILYGLGKLTQILAARSDRDHRLQRRLISHWHGSI